jgi:signal transduction histidine kinase
LALEDAGQRLEVRARPGLRVLGDRQLLRQALTNLIDNASKYGRANQTIRLDAEANHGDRVLLTVTDQGLGVPAGLRARLLEPYERLPRDQASERTGTGLGLAVVVQIAQACGGSVRLEGSLSGEGGTRAVMVLKAAPSSAAP